MLITIGGSSIQYQSAAKSRHKPGSDRVQPGFAGPDPNGFLDVGHVDLAVADPPVLVRAPDRVDCLLDQVITDHDLAFDLGQAVHDVLGRAVKLAVHVR